MRTQSWRCRPQRDSSGGGYQRSWGRLVFWLHKIHFSFFTGPESHKEWTSNFELLCSPIKTIKEKKIKVVTASSLLKIYIKQREWIIPFKLTKFNVFLSHLLQGSLNSSTTNRRFVHDYSQANCIHPPTTGQVTNKIVLGFLGSKQIRVYSVTPQNIHRNLL